MKPSDARKNAAAVVSEVTANYAAFEVQQKKTARVAKLVRTREILGMEASAIAGIFANPETSSRGCLRSYALKVTDPNSRPGEEDAADIYAITAVYQGMGKDGSDKVEINYYQATPQITDHEFEGVVWLSTGSTTKIAAVSVPGGTEVSPGLDDSGPAWSESIDDGQLAAQELAWSSRMQEMCRVLGRLSADGGFTDQLQLED